MSQSGAYEFGADDVPGTELAVYDADAPQVVDEAFRQLVGGPQEQILIEERHQRAASFEAAHAAITGWEATFGRRPTFHRTYADQDGLTVERRAVVQPLDFPGLGNLTRLIVNDESPASDGSSMRQVRIRDFIISNCAKAFSWQESSISRAWDVHQWGELTGPLIQQRSDHIDIVNGPHYATFLPRVGGYRTTLFESIERRLRVEEFTEVLGTLGIASYDPYEINSYV